MAESSHVDYFQAPDAFHQLVQDLSSVLGPSSGIDSADVDPHTLQDLMREYVSNQREWKQYALGDSSRPYTRNLVDKGNGRSNLVRLSIPKKALDTFLTPKACPGLDTWKREPDP